MDPTFLLFLALAALILILLILLGLFLLPRLMKSLGSRGGGWSLLGGHFPASFSAGGGISETANHPGGPGGLQKMRHGWGTLPGLYLEVKIPFSSRLKPLLIPWERIKGIREGSLHWKKTMILSIGEPEIGTVTLFLDLFAQVRPFLDPKLLSLQLSEIG